MICKEMYPQLAVEEFVASDTLESLVTRDNIVSMNSTFISMRLRGTQYWKDGDMDCFIAWERNIVSIQKMDVSLPTVVFFNVNSEGKIINIKLGESFAGSQGITCSRMYLQKVLEKKLNNTEFSTKNENIRDLDKLHCLHLHEVMFGAVSFYEWCKERNYNKAFESEVIEPHFEGKDLVFVNRHKMSGDIHVVCKLKMENSNKAMIFNKEGNIEKVENLGFSYYQVNKSQEEIELYKECINEDNNKNFNFKILRVMNRCWRAEKKRIGVKGEFGNSILDPGTITGLIIQVVALIRYNNNYPYFQYCINSLQRPNDKPQCIGVIKSLEEGELLFKGFKGEYLY